MTLVGQGTFNNPFSLMRTALAKVANILKGHDRIRVYIHAFDKKDETKIRNAATSEAFTLIDIEKEEFVKRSDNFPKDH